MSILSDRSDMPRLSFGRGVASGTRRADTACFESAGEPAVVESSPSALGDASKPTDPDEKSRDCDDASVIFVSVVSLTLRPLDTVWRSAGLRGRWPAKAASAGCGRISDTVLSTSGTSATAMALKSFFLTSSTDVGTREKKAVTAKTSTATTTRMRIVIVSRSLPVFLQRVQIMPGTTRW